MHNTQGIEADIDASVMYFERAIPYLSAKADDVTRRFTRQEDGALHPMVNALSIVKNRKMLQQLSSASQITARRAPDRGRLQVVSPYELLSTMAGSRLRRIGMLAESTKNGAETRLAATRRDHPLRRVSS